MKGSSPSSGSLERVEEGSRVRLRLPWARIAELVAKVVYLLLVGATTVMVYEFPETGRGRLGFLGAGVLFGVCLHFYISYAGNSSRTETMTPPTPENPGAEEIANLRRELADLRLGRAVPPDAHGQAADGPSLLDAYRDFVHDAAVDGPMSNLPREDAAPSPTQLDPVPWHERPLAASEHMSAA